MGGGLSRDKYIPGWAGCGSVESGHEPDVYPKFKMLYLFIPEHESCGNTYNETYFQ